MKEISPPIIFTSKRKNQILIREAKATDVTAIWKLFNDVVRERRFIPTLSPVRDLLEQQTWYEESIRKGSIMIVAIKDDQLVGYCTIERCKDEAASHCGILGILVTNKMRNEGIGKQLISHALEKCKSNRFKKVCLSVFDDNELAIKLYQKLGFKISGRRKHQFIIDGTYRDEILMDLILHSE